MNYPFGQQVIYKPDFSALRRTEIKVILFYYYIIFSTYVY
jgi:hypothetical protein